MAFVALPPVAHIEESCAEEASVDVHELDTYTD